MYVEELKIPQSSNGCSLKEGNCISSCKGLVCECKQIIPALRGSSSLEYGGEVLSERHY